MGQHVKSVLGLIVSADSDRVSHTATVRHDILQWQRAAAINAAQAHPLTWKTVVKRALVVAVAGAAT